MFGLGGGLSGFVNIGPSGNLFDFEVGDQFTFTSCNLSGADGPTISQMQSHYLGAYGAGWYTSTDFLDTPTDTTNSQKVDGVQMMTIPASGTYLLTLQAPRTKYTASPQRRGAKLAVEIDLIKEEKIYVVVGQQGGVGSYNGGGSGGTFVFKLQDLTNEASAFQLIAAAGGGGGQGPNNSSKNNAACDASLTSSGQRGVNADGTTLASAGGSSGSAGSLDAGNQYSAGPGAGWLTTSRVEGTTTTSCNTYSQNVSSGLGLLSSVVGGKRTVLQTSFTGGHGQNSSNDDLKGGFGGGGGGSGACGSSGSGGGGGYSGGGVGNDCCDSSGGGGGTYINTSIVTTTITSPTLYDESNGYMTIRRTA